MCAAFSLGILFAAAANADPGPGAYPAEIAAWDSAVKDKQRQAGKEMLALIEKAVREKAPEVKIPKGDYRFAETTGARPTHILLKEISNLTIDFQGSTLWFETQASGIVLTKYENLTLKNVTLDWDPLPYFQGTITAVDTAANTFDMRLDEGYERVLPGMAGEQGARGSWRGLVFDSKTREIKAGQKGFSVGFSWQNRNADGTYKVRFRGFHEAPVGESGVAVGDPVAILSRMERAVRIEGGKGCVLEDITLYSSPFVAFAQNTGDGATFRRCNILRRPGTNRLLAGNADGINCANAGAPPLLENCRMETLGDDFVNVHGHLARVIWQNSPTEIISSRMNYRGTIKEPVEIEFLERATMKSLGRRLATAEPEPSWEITKEKCLANLDHKWHSGEASGLEYHKKMALQKITLDQPIELKGDIIIACEKFSGAGAVIRNCDFRGSLARGIRMQSPGARIENNRIALTMGPGVSLVGHAGYWGEGPYVHSATLTGNTFEDNSISGVNKDRAAVIISEGNARENRLPHDIRIEGNRFIRPAGSAILARGVENLSIKENEITGYGWMPASAARQAGEDEGKAKATAKDKAKGAGYAVSLENIGGLVLEGNRISNPGAFAAGEIFKDDAAAPPPPPTPVGTGPYPADIAAWDDATKQKQREAGRAMLKHIQDEVARGTKEIRIARGDYRFAETSQGKYPAHITWEGLDGVTLDFQGSTLWLDHPHTAITMRKCRGVMLKNVFLDWDPLPFMQGVITETDSTQGTFDVTLDAGYERVTPRMGPGSSSKGWRGVAFDRNTRELKEGQAGFSLNFSWDNRNADGSYRVKYRGFYERPITESGLDTGDRIVILARMGRAVRLEEITDCTLQDVTLYSSPFIGFASWAGSGTVFRRCGIVPRPGTNRLIGGNADGINCANMSRGPLIEDCVIQNIGDDFINIHASLARVIAQESSDQIITSVLNNRRDIPQELTLEFFERRTMLRLAERKARRVEYIPEWTIAWQKERCPADLDHKWNSGDAAGLAYGKTVSAHRIVLDSPYEVKGDVIVTCKEFSSAGAIIRGNRFRGSLARGIRQQSPDVLIENNSISRTASYGLSMFGHASFWGEGPYVYNAKILNNRFEDTCISKGSSEEGAIVVREGNFREQRLPHDIVIHGNTIVRTGGCGIQARGVDGLEITGNSVTGYGWYARGKAKDTLKAGTPQPHGAHALLVDFSTRVVVNDNTLANPGTYAQGEKIVSNLADSQSAGH